MTSLVIGVLFLACLFFSPLATSLPKEIDGAALLYVAILFVRNITDIEWKEADYAITLCGSANETCVSMPWPENCIKFHWPIKDPKTSEEFQSARDDIKRRVEKFLEEL